MTEGQEINLSCLEPDDASREALAEKLRQANKNDPRTFGLQPYANDPSARLGFFVGVGRLREAPNRPLIVIPRKFGFDEAAFRIDYVRMYAECAAEPEVGRHLDRCLTVHADEAPVELQDDHGWSPLIALAYLKALRDLIRRHLRYGFVRREEDLRGRVRGRVEARRLLTRSLARGRPDIIPCSFETFERDTPENRILRTALAAARRLLPASGERVGDAQEWVREADAALAGAAITRIHARDFRTARRSGAYRHYAGPLDLARAVLTRAGFDPNNPRTNATRRMIPFRLATAELFERYVEVCLRKSGWKVVAGYDDQNLGKTFRIRPDFLITNGSKRRVVDAKYKDIHGQRPGAADDENSFRSDVYQVMAYTRHKEARKILGMDRDGDANRPTSAILAYPTAAPADANGQELPGGWTCVKSYNDFDIPLIAASVPVPAIHS